MATSKTSKLIGVIAEDLSDINVVGAILEKYVAKNTFAIRRFVGNGCGKLRNKCKTWTEMLLKSGCTHVLVFHDLDRCNEAELRAVLEKKLPANKYPTTMIIIPIEEIEAWLLSDIGAIKAAFNLKDDPKSYKDCEAVKSPKQEIERVVWSLGKKRYLNTVHNRRIAEKTTLASLRRCSSYMKFDEYVIANLFPGNADV